MTTITNHVLRQLIQNTAKPTTNKIQTSSSNSTTETEEEVEVNITTKEFHRIGQHGTTIIFNDNTTAPLLSPIPCIQWKAATKEDTNGTAALSIDIKATVLQIGKTQIILGFDPTTSAVSTQLEYLIDLGESEVRMTNEYLSIKAKTLAKNGVEI